MTGFLLRTFVKNFENTNDPKVHSAIGKLAGAAGIICNILLFAGKLTVGLLIGSVSIVADAINNLSDASSSVITLLGFRLAQRPADEDHPYGHARYEYLSGLVVTVLILLIGLELVKSSIEKILHPAPVEVTLVTVIVLLCSIGIKFWMMRFYRSLGGRIHSTALQAASADSRNDVVATSAVLAGGLVGRFFGLNVDGYVGLAVAVFIFYSGVMTGKETISPLLGKQADEDLVEKIRGIILSHEKILGVHDLLVHDYGPGQCFASVHAEIGAGEDLLKSHDVIDDIENDVLEQLNVHLVIHYDPVVTDDAEWNEMRGITEKIVGEISQELSIHDFRLVKGDEHTKLVFDLEVPYSMNGQEQEIKRRIDEKLRVEIKRKDCAYLEIGAAEQRDGSSNAGICKDINENKYVTVIRFDGKA